MLGVFKKSIVWVLKSTLIILEISLLIVYMFSL